MMTLLIGHRGVGKTSLLKRLEEYALRAAEKILTIDLDAYIEAKTGKLISEIFNEDGEESFREMEKKYFAELANINSKTDIPTFVSVGAGYKFNVPEGIRCLWVQRDSDLSGRVFLDRPRLVRSIRPLNEFWLKFGQREKRFANDCTETWLLPEGVKDLCDFEEQIFFKNLNSVGGCLTILPRNIKSLAEFIKNKDMWSIERFELRDDVLSQKEIEFALGIIPKNKVLLSFRNANADSEFCKKQMETLDCWDWALELGVCPNRNAPITSLHEFYNGESLLEAIARLEKNSGKSSHLKFAPIVSNFSDLIVGYNWCQEDLQNRSFLPRSHDGKWKWFRLLLKNKIKLNFWCEGRSEVKDQPSLWQWCQVPAGFKTFAAILGDPVNHSWTPMEQAAFFLLQKNPVFAVNVNEREWERGAIKALTKMGLRFAAVTSPLKVLAQELTGEKTSINTLAYNIKTNSWEGCNTDDFGLEILLEGLQKSRSEKTNEQRVCVWGGGGTLDNLKKVFPQAQFYSARTGKPRIEKTESFVNPQVVIWAVGRKRMDNLNWPPEKWKPNQIIDPNYSEESPGREYAQKVNAKYTSGAKMFQAQAKKQRDFWKKYFA